MPLFGRKRGRSQKGHEEEYGDQAQLTCYKPKTDTLQQPSSPSVTVTDGHQSVSQSARNFQLSTDFVDSTVGRNSSHNSSSHKLTCQSTTSPTAQSIQVPKTDASLPQIQAVEVDKGNHCLLVQTGENLTSRWQQASSSSFPLEPNIVERISGTVSHLQATVPSESKPSPMGTPEQPSRKQHSSSVYSLGSLSSGYSTRSPSPGCSTRSSSPSHSPKTEASTAVSQLQPSPINTPEQLRKRHYSDSKMTRYRRLEIRNQLRSGKLRHVTDVIPIPEDSSLDSVAVRSQENHSTSQLIEKVAESSGVSSMEEEMRSRVKHNLPKFIAQTKWEYLVPYLVATDLSDSATNEYLLNEHKSHQEKGVHFYLRVLPSKGRDAYTRFHRCLCDEKEHLGHQSLLKILILRQQLAEEQEISKVLSIDSEGGEMQSKVEITSTSTAGNIRRTGYLRGAEVVAETDVVLTNEATSYLWEGCGFKLSVPKNSLPEGIPECSVNVKASLTGHFELPEGLELVSAVYWVYISEQFMKPVTIEVQHCANFSHPDQLHFIHANCTQKSLPYKFEIVDGGSFTLGSKYGALSTSKFSGNGIAKEVAPGEHSCQYCAQVYFTVKHLQDFWYCHFVVTKDIDMCLAVVQRKYQQDYDIAPPITFGDDHIALVIPEDGAQTSNGWRIVPQYIPVIYKERVNNFSSEQSWVPECVLLLEWLHKEKNPDQLEYKVKMLGAKEEKAFFRIFLHPERFLQQQYLRQQSSISASSVQRPSSETSDEQSQTTPSQGVQAKLTIDDVLEVTNYLLDLTQTDIHNLGLTLGLNHPHLKNMASSETFRDDMIAAWLQKEDQVTKRGVPTWETLVKALRDRRVNQTGVADKIEADKIVTM